MKLLPVAARELRVSARRRELFIQRTAAAAVGLLIAGFILLAVRALPGPQQAQALFPALSGFALLYCLLCGLVTADCLSEEKREGTLGLLFLTDLRAFDIIAGKVLAASLLALAALLALLPVLALPLLLGGVPADAVWRMALLLVVTMAFSLAAGVMVSALCRDARRALGGTLLVIVLVMAGPSLLRGALFAALGNDPLPGLRAWLEPALPPRLGNFAWLHVPNPVAAFVDIVAGAFGGARLGMYWPAVAAVALGALACLAVALVALPRVWQDRPAGGRATAAARDAARAEQERRARTAALLPLPFAWIVTRQRAAARAAWLGLLALAAGWTYGLLELGSDWLEAPVALVTGWALMAWVKVQLAAAACGPFHEQRRTGALELLLCTPQTPGELVRGHLEGLRRQFLGPLAAAGGGAAALFLLVLLTDTTLHDDRAMVWSLLGTGLFFLAADAAALTAMGMWQGLSAPKLARAVSQTTALVLVAPWVLWVLLLVVIGLLVDLLGLDALDGLDGFWTPLALFLLVGALTAGLNFYVAWGGLRTRLRGLALEHYGPAPGRGWRPFRRRPAA